MYKSGAKNNYIHDRGRFAAVMSFGSRNCAAVRGQQRLSGFSLSVNDMSMSFPLGAAAKISVGGSHNIIYSCQA